MAHIKGTVLLMPNGSDVVTKAPVVQEVQSDKKVEDAGILELLACPIKKEKKKVRAHAGWGGVGVDVACEGGRGGATAVFGPRGFGEWTCWGGLAGQLVCRWRWQC